MNHVQIFQPYQLSDTHSQHALWNALADRHISESKAPQSAIREWAVMARLASADEPLAQFAEFLEQQQPPYQPGELGSGAVSWSHFVGGQRAAEGEARPAEALTPMLIEAARRTEANDPRREVLSTVMTELYLPHAEKLAKNYCLQKGHERANLDDYLGKASDGLQEAIANAFNKPNFKPTNFMGFCTTVINRRLTDQTRSDLGRKGQKLALASAVSLEFKPHHDGERVQSHAEQAWAKRRTRTSFDATEMVDVQDTIDYLKRRVTGLLGPMEMLVLETVLNDFGQNHTRVELARSIDMKPGTFMTHIHNIREKMDELDPQLFQRMQDELGLFKDEGVVPGGKT